MLVAHVGLLSRMMTAALLDSGGCFRSVQLTGGPGGPSREPVGGVAVAPLFSARPLLHFRLALIRCGHLAVTGVKVPAPEPKSQW
jgi:hypothetical protein